MVTDALSYVRENIQKALAGKEFEDVRDHEHYQFIGITQIHPEEFRFGSVSCKVVCKDYSFFELENLKEVGSSQLEQAAQTTSQDSDDDVRCHPPFVSSD